MRRLAGKVVYDREGPAGWAIVVMPDYFLVDSYHGPPHVHTRPGQRGDRKLPVRVRGRDEALRIVLGHIETHQGVRRALLLAELGAGKG